MTRARTLAALAGLLFLPGAWRTPPDDLAARVTIYRDTYGIPHVFGETDAATMFGFAYAQAEDNFWRLEDNYIRALGRRAEVEGERTSTASNSPRMSDQRRTLRPPGPSGATKTSGWTRRSSLNEISAGEVLASPRALPCR